MAVPVIETERLRLRAHTLHDLGPMTELWADPVVVRHITGKPSSPEETWSRLTRYAGHWALLGFGFWAIEEKASGAFVGEGGFADFKRDMEPAIDTPEQGWVLSPAVHGRGYATEAVNAMIAWAEPHFGRRDFACIISPTNQASIRVAQKAGYREVVQTAYKGESILLLRRDA